MSLFQTGFKVDASVPVASTSTTAHPAAGSAHKKRKRDSNAATATATSGGILSSPLKTSGQASSSNKGHVQPSSSSNKNEEEIDIYRMLEGSAAATAGKGSSSSKTAEAVVNIEKLMRKLERMEKGGKTEKPGSSTISSSDANKKQRTGNEKHNEYSGSVQTSSSDKKGKGKDVNSNSQRNDGPGSSSAINGAAESSKSRNKQNKKKKKIETALPKSDYVPDEAALAKREARRLKKEAQAIAKKASSAAMAGNGDEQEGPGEADDSAMHIDSLEVSNIAQETVPGTQADSKKAKKKSKSNKAANDGDTSIIDGADQQHTSQMEEDLQTKQKLSKKKEQPNQSQVQSVAVPAATKDAEAGMTDLQKRMQKKLGGARFRWINEQLYTTTGKDALALMEEDPAMFEDYHNGFASQAASWPAQPIQLFIDYFRKTYISSVSSSKPVIADLGCGKAELAATLVPLGFTVLSYDLVESEPYIVKAQCTKRLPLPGSSDRSKEDAPGSVVDFVVCCLSLMGNDWLGMISEARRVLKAGGKLKIAEVTSRFDDVKAFISLITAMGFKLLKKDDSNTHFILFDFEKIPMSACKSPFLGISEEAKILKSNELLKPCIYKRR